MGGHTFTTQHWYLCSILPICCYNISGSVRDSKVAEELGDVFFRLGTVNDSVGTWKKRAVNFAFSLKKCPFILVKSTQHDPTGFDAAEFARGISRMNREATAMQRSAELGMWAIQSSFPRLLSRDCFLHEETWQKEKNHLKDDDSSVQSLRQVGWYCPKIKNTFMLALYVNASTTLYVV